MIDHAGIFDFENGTAVSSVGFERFPTAGGRVIYRAHIVGETHIVTEDIAKMCQNN